MREVDVLIIGAGPAGSVCGYLLKKEGVDCLIVDFASFPREKVCGGGLTPKAWRLLESLIPHLKYDYLPVNRLRLQFENDPVCEFNSEFELRMTQRKEFDYTLLKNYQEAGGEFVQDAFAKYEELSEGRILVTLKSGTQLSCRYLVAADGANSRVRRQMFGPYKSNILFMEQYVEPTTPSEIYIHFSREHILGGFYKFPGPGRDIYGYGGPGNNRDYFRQLLEKFGVPATHFIGANIPMEVKMSENEHIILIGDAGGYPNRITGEGLYDAFKTAYNAKRAIVENIPFWETNRAECEKMKSQEKLYKFASTKIGYITLRFALRHPSIFKWMFDAKMKRETFRERK